MAKTYNFNPGPSSIPESVLNKAQAEMFNFEQSGMAIMELSHRSSLYENVHFHAMDQIRKILKVPKDYEILFLQGGASLQFSMLAMNFLTKGKQAAYVLTGSWSEKAQLEGDAIGQTYTLASSKKNQYQNIPSVDLSEVKENTAYVHLTSNNTIYGSQWPSFPKKSDTPVIIDMSSDVLSRAIPWDDVDMMYAGAQKNAGMAGVTLVVIKKTLLDSANDKLPPSLSYKQHASKDSLYNTPPTTAIYMTSLVLDWIDELGGIESIEKRAKEKAKIIYHLIDHSKDFFIGHADHSARSLMNITFRLPSEELESAFLAEATKAGFKGLNGHRSVGGCRVSNYNAVPIEHVNILHDFMVKFMDNHH